MAITKTDFMRGMECPKMLWLDKHKPSLKVIPPEIQTRLDAGNDFGDQAMGMFGPYKETTVYRPGTTIPDKAAMLQRTQEHLEAETPVICEAAFSNYNNYCAVDILPKTDTGYDFYEVKNAPEVYPQFVKDAGFRYYIMARCKMKIGKVYIVIHGPDEENPFVPVDVTAEAKSYYKWINDHIWDLNRIKSLGYDTGERSLAERTLDLGCTGLTLLLVWLLLRWGGASPEIGGASFGALFLVGLSTSPHCLGMCGGILLSACRGREGQKALFGAALAYNGGRAASYTALGAVFGALGTVLMYTLSMKSMLFTMLGLVVALLGLNMWGLLLALPSLPGEQNAACRLPERLRRQTPLLVGLLTGFMPCGALYAAWLCAMSSGSAGNGALLMLAFALGTVPLMLLFASLGALLPRGWTKYLRKLGAVLVTSMGLKMLIGGLLLLRG